MSENQSTYNPHIEPRILGYYLKLYSAIGCEKPFTSMILKDLTNAINPQEVVMKLRKAGLSKKADETLNGKIAYRLIDLKTILKKVDYIVATKTIRALSACADTEDYLEKVLMVISGKNFKSDSVVFDFLKQIPFGKYPKNQLSDMIQALYSQDFYTVSFIKTAVEILCAKNEIAAFNLSASTLIPAVAQVVPNIKLACESTDFSKAIADIFSIKTTNPKEKSDYVLAGLVQTDNRQKDFELMSKIVDSTGIKAVCLTFPSTTFRGGLMTKLRKELAMNNFVEAVITFPNKTLTPKTNISPVLIILSKYKTDEKIQFINAQKLEPCEQTLKKIVDAYLSKPEVEGFSRNVSALEVLKNEGNLDPTVYVKEHCVEPETDLKETLKYLESTNSLPANTILDINKFMKTAFDPVMSRLLKDVCNVRRLRITKNDLQDGKTSLVTENDVLVQSSSLKVEDIGSVYVSTDKLHAGDYVKLSLTQNSEIKSNDFLCVILRSAEFVNYVQNKAKGTVIKVISANDVSNFAFKLPTTNDQERVLKLQKQIEQSKNNLKTTFDCLNDLSKNLLNSLSK